MNQEPSLENPPAKADLRGMRVACFYPWNPFESTGAWVRFTCLWQYLLGAGAEVTLAFLDKGKDAQLENVGVRFHGEYNLINSIGRYASSLLANGKSELRHYSASELTFLLMYDKNLYLEKAGTASWLDQVIAEHDVVTCDYPMYAPLLSDFCRKLHKPLVVTSLDVLYELHGVHPSAKERLRKNEVEALGLADALVFCNDQERQLFEGFGLKGVTVRNTGDVLSVTPGNEDRSRDAVRSVLKVRTPQYCLFVGSTHGPNLAAAAEMKNLAKRMPELTFVVAGACHPKSVDGNFIALGGVPEELLDQLYRGALAVVVPLTQGTGMSVKVFQAFTYEKAVVTTAVGARGYSLTDGEEFLLANQPADFPAAIRRLAADGGFRKRLAQKARAYALRHDFRTHFAPYGEIIARLVNPPATPAPVRDASLVLVDNNLCDRIGHHFNYALSLKAECAAQGRSFRALVKRSAGESVLAELAATATFSQGIHEESALNPYPPEWGPIRSTYDFLLANDCFQQELEAGLRRKVRADDVVFLPNATPRQLLGLALLLTRSPLHRSLRYVVMLRYSVYLPTGPIADRKLVSDKDAAEKYTVALERLVAADPRGAVRLVTDSAELAKEYGAFVKRAFEVLPIPHASEAVPVTWPAAVPAKSPGKIRIIYLGDAREEKGFELLPALVRSCLATPSCAAVEFVVQAFISSIYHQRMALVIEELVKLAGPRVHLVRSPLSTEAYQALLSSADLVLLPYDAATYRARTSGPFVEAICANKPVVVPRNSWLSARLENSAAGVTFTSGNGSDFVRAGLAAVTNLPAHAAAATELGKQFRAFHNPQNFVRCIMQSA